MLKNLKQNISIKNIELPPALAGGFLFSAVQGFSQN